MRKWFVFSAAGMIGYVYATDLFAAEKAATERYGGFHRITYDC